jgi:hypothetical protein
VIHSISTCVEKVSELKNHDPREPAITEKMGSVFSSLDLGELLPVREQPDSGVDFTIKRGSTLLLIQAKAHLWPNEVPSVAHGLLEHCRKTDAVQCVPLIVAPSVSNRTAERCRELGISWADFAGNCHIQFNDVLIHVEGKKGKKAPTRGTVSLYTPRAARIVHALLIEPWKSWRVVDLAERTQVSLGQVSNVRKLLVRNAFVEAGDDGVRLMEPRQLLLDWARNYRPRRTVRRYYSLRRPGELERALTDHLPSYALTELAAAERYAPYTRYQSVSFYVPNWLSHHEKALDLRPADSTPNVAVYEDADGLLFSESQGGVPVASPIVTYLDLTLLGGRGQDAADHLLETTILPRWS